MAAIGRVLDPEQYVEGTISPHVTEGQIPILHPDDSNIDIETILGLIASMFILVAAIVACCYCPPKRD